MSKLYYNVVEILNLSRMGGIVLEYAKLQYTNLQKNIYILMVVLIFAGF